MEAGLFGSGTINDIKLVGDKKDMAIVEFSNIEDAKQGQQLHGMQLGDRCITVTAPVSSMSQGVLPTNPILALQMQQLQQMQVSDWLGVSAMLDAYGYGGCRCMTFTNAVGRHWGWAVVH